MKNTPSKTIETTLPVSNVEVFFIDHNEVNPIKHEKANDSDYWRNFTMIGYKNYYHNFRNLRSLAVKFKDVTKMIEMNSFQFVDIVDLLKKHAIIYNNNMPGEDYLNRGYFHYSQERIYRSNDSESEEFENLFVTFRGLRLVSDLINIDDSKENLELLSDKNHFYDCGPRNVYDANW